MPFNHTELFALVQRMTSYIMDTANRERMDFGTTTKTGKWFTDEYVPAVTDYMSVYNDWKNPAERVPAKQEKLEKTEKTFRPLLRTLYTFFLKYNYFVTDEDLVSMGLPDRSEGKPTPSPVATEAPWFEVLLKRIAAIVIEYSVAKRKKAKAPGQHGVECCWVISDHPVIDHEELVHSAFDTRTPLVLEFPGHDRGKTVYFALRWENTRGQKGPFSRIENVVIP
jgi:hypothetical protein